MSLTTLRLSLAIILALPVMAEPQAHFDFTTVRGYFLQDEADTDPDSFDYVASNFGLINRPYDTDGDLKGKNTTQWQRFAHHLHRLNYDSSPNVSYRLLFLGRHGEGVHNVAEARYGSAAWDCYWSLKEGDGSLTWVDAELTTKGVQQAQAANSAWKAQISHHVPFPQSYYVSPLKRCLDTANVTFQGLDMPLVKPFRPIIKELVRETIGLHTCDRRSPASRISHDYPLFRVEPGFTQNDTLWSPDWRESNTARNVRLREALFDIFAHDPHTVISVTSHSGAISSVLEVVGHRTFSLVTGAMIPVLVRVKIVPGEAERLRVDPPSGRPNCSCSTTSS